MLNDGDNMSIVGKSLRDIERIGTHSHIKGLGVVDGEVKKIASGLVGQVEARKAAWIVVKMIKKGKFAGKAILLVGPPGTGKTAMAIAIARELGKDTPFMAISGSEIYSAEMKKTEVLMQALRKSIGIRVREFRTVYEGMVKKMEIKFDRHPYNPYQQVPVEGYITLKTTKEEKTLSVPGSIISDMLNKGIVEGDVIWIDQETGRVYKVGKAKEGEKKYDIYGEEIVPIPSGPILKEKELIHTITLHDLDVLNARRGSLLSILFGGPQEREIPSEVRTRVDETVKEWIEEGKAEIIPGVLFIDDVHMLDIEAFSFLSRAMESDLSPIIILASNRGFTKIRGTDIIAPHGLPLDLLDRLLIIKTTPYKEDEIREIIKIRAKEEKVELEDGALEILTELGVKQSLRYAVQLLTPSYIISKERNHEKIKAEDVLEASKLFISMKESSQYLKTHEESFLK